MTPEWVSVTDYARIFSVSRPTVYKWIEAGGILTCFQVDHVIRILNLPPGEKPPTPAVPLVLPPMPTAELRAIPDVKRAAQRVAGPPIQVGKVPVPECPGVYVVRSGIAAKIGCAKNLQRRLQSLQIAHPSPLIVVGFIPTDTERAAHTLEHQLHRQFKDKRIRGEWFRLTADIVDVLKRRGTWHYPSLVVEMPKVPE